MKAETALEKRIRRQVIGRTLDFFAATAPGLEEICEKELMSLPLTLKEMRTVNGGVEFRGRLHDSYMANLHLCTANRILMRIGECRAEGFPQMEKRLRDFPWELYLHPGEMPDFSISTERCRLYHKEAIRERFEKSIAACPALINRDAAAGEKIPQRIFIRGLHDVFHISIDSSGEHLHKRGIRKYSADAPLRETNAAAILKIAEYDGKAPLMDPMCGSGTFSLEAAMMSARIPPGFYRDFAFTGWPSFQDGRWRHLLREAGEQILQTGEKANIFASDIDEKACQALKENIGEAPFESRIHVSQSDFFSFSPDQLTDSKGLVVINPPYGHRMGSPDQAAELIPAICDHLAAAYKGWTYAILVPEAKGIRNLRYRKQTFFHGGLQLNLLTGRIR